MTNEIGGGIPLIVIVFLFSIWGGGVRFLMKCKNQPKFFKIKNLISQLFVSSFSGCFFAIYGMEIGYSKNIVILISAACSTLGGGVIKYIWSLLYKNINVMFNKK